MASNMHTIHPTQDTMMEKERDGAAGSAGGGGDGVENTRRKYFTKTIIMIIIPVANLHFKVY